MYRRLFKVKGELNSVGYDSARQLIELQYKSGQIHYFHKVPQKIYDALFNSNDPYKYFNENIRYIYPRHG